MLAAAIVNRQESRIAEAELQLRSGPAGQGQGGEGEGEGPEEARDEGGIQRSSGSSRGERGREAVARSRGHNAGSGFWSGSRADAFRGASATSGRMVTCPPL